MNIAPKHLLLFACLTVLLVTGFLWFLPSEPQNELDLSGVLDSSPTRPFPTGEHVTTDTVTSSNKSQSTPQENVQDTQQKSETGDVDIDGFWDAVGLGDVSAKEAILNLADMYVNRDFDDIAQIEAIVQSPEFYDPDFVKQLLDAYIDADDVDLQQGLQDLAFLADDQAVVYTIAQHASAYDELTQMAALSLLEGVDLSEQTLVRDMIYHTIDRSSNPSVVALALDTLSYSPNNPQHNALTLDKIRTSLRHDSLDVRAIAASKLIEVDPQKQSQHLVREALNDPSEQVQLAIFQAIADAQYFTDDIHADLKRISADETRSDGLRSSAINLLRTSSNLSDAE